jgi:hypothetical protein
MLFHSLIESGEARRRLQEQIFASQSALIQQLSAPILPRGSPKCC